VAACRDPATLRRGARTAIIAAVAVRPFSWLLPNIALYAFGLFTATVALAGYVQTCTYLVCGRMGS
jgi:hypothetical protein